MNTNKTFSGATDSNLYSEQSGERKTSLCWKSILGGFLIALLAYLTLTSLGAGIGGFRAAQLIARDADSNGLMTGAGVWLGISAVISLFLGGFFATLASATHYQRAGIAHGLIVAAVFFAWLLHGAGNSIGSFVQINGGMSSDVTANDVEKAARTLADVGWFLFITLVLGTMASALGGYEGVRANSRKPLHYTPNNKS